MAVEPTRVEIGCGFLFLVDLIALAALVYLALVSGLLFPMDCASPHDIQCAAEHSMGARLTFGAFGLTIVGNALALIWIFRRKK